MDVNAFGGKTYVQTGKWVWKDNHQYWQEADGAYARNKEIYDASTDAWYWIDADGSMAQNKDVYLRSNGGKWVYYDEVTGKMVYEEKYLNADETSVGWYYFDPVTGKRVTGDVYLKSNGGKWVRYDENGKMVKGLQYRDKSWHYFDSTTGAMAYGRTWVPQWDAWHYFDTGTGRG